MSGDITFRDWQHASRLFLVDSFKLAPKVKFLYHVTFYLGENASSFIPIAKDNMLQIGMLVKNTDLPKYSAKVETLNKYNRKKNVQTSIEYMPINMTLHDDNAGYTRHMLEGYYRYYYADGNQEWDNGSYGNPSTGDTTYRGSVQNSYRYGLDNHGYSGNKVPFFERIEIAQLARGQYFLYTLIKPLLTEWSHDNLDYSETNGITENRITVAYEGVNYSQGKISGDTPTGFGNESHYDTWEA